MSLECLKWYKLTAENLPKEPGQYTVLFCRCENDLPHLGKVTRWKEANSTVELGRLDGDNYLRTSASYWKVFKYFMLLAGPDGKMMVSLL